MHDKPVYEFSESETLERGDERSGRGTSGLQASRGASILASAGGQDGPWRKCRQPLPDGSSDAFRRRKSL